jgi:uncharacterized membrane-anchored protein YhcB (DUF1043 family)
MNEMMAKWEEEKRRTVEQLEEESRRSDDRWEEERRRINERFTAQSQMTEKIQKMIENLATANATLVGNTSAMLDT